MSEDELTHTDERGSVHMVDVGDKDEDFRRAVATGSIHLESETFEAVRDNEVGKGDVLSTTRIAAIQAVKHTWETVPLCHQIPITSVETDVELEPSTVSLTVAVETVGKTGCEMEALQGVTTGLNTIWDMTKALEKDERGQYPETAIEGIRVVEKTVDR